MPKYGAWIAVIVLGWFLCAGLATAQSVAGVAKKSKEQSANKKAKTVITNDTLPSKAKSPAGPAEASPPGTAPAPGEPKSADERSKLEKEYLQKFQNLYTQYEENRLQYEKNDAERYHSSARYYHERMDKNMEQIKALEEQARKDGLAPGLSRQAHKDVRKKLVKEGKIKE